MNIFLNYTYLTENVTFFARFQYTVTVGAEYYRYKENAKIRMAFDDNFLMLEKKNEYVFISYFFCCCWVSYVLKIKKMIFISPLICLNYFDFRVQKLVFPFIPGTSDLSWKDVQKNVICNCIYYELNPKKINSLQTITFTC